MNTKKKKNLIREVLKDFYHEASTIYTYIPDSVLDRASAQIKEIFLGYVGGDRTTGEPRDWSYNTAKQEIRDKVMG